MGWRSARVQPFPNLIDYCNGPRRPYTRMHYTFVLTYTLEGTQSLGKPDSKAEFSNIVEAFAGAFRLLGLQQQENSYPLPNQHLGCPPSIHNLCGNIASENVDQFDNLGSLLSQELSMIPQFNTNKLCQWGFNQVEEERPRPNCLSIQQ